MSESAAKKILVTGGSGFAGSHLLEHLLKNTPHSLFGTYLNEDSLKILHNTLKEVSFKKLDLTSEDETLLLIKEIKPDYIFHLAAFSSSAASFDFPKETIVNNINSQINLLEAVKNAKIDPKILVVSSGDIYGQVKKEDLPIKEDVVFNPSSPYSVSKIAQDFLALQYFLSFGLRIVRVRPFNHIGPRQSPDFVVSAFAKKIAEIEKGQGGLTLNVGNLSSERDFTDVVDIVRGYWEVLEKGRAGDVYNMGSGRAVKIENVLKILLSFSSKEIKVKEDPSLFRPSENKTLVCDCSKIKKEIGWENSIKLEASLKNVLDYWRNII
ncbi:GDP-mannose 4,6-dehydratase [Patescibacteria group bacterium]|nr:GDP-mannose 4,6-dehydratase [Patescibacteria group bacterium]